MLTELNLQSDLFPAATTNISELLRQLLADAYTLYLKTKNFHWHVSGPHFRDYHLLLDEQANQIFAVTDALAERARKIGGKAIHSINEISRLRRIEDNEEEFVPPEKMLRELAWDNHVLTEYLRSAHETCDRYNDIATASLLEVWIDEAERRSWFLREAVQGID